MKNVKTVTILCIVLTVVVVAGFVVVLARKQTVNPETGEVKSHWGKASTTVNPGPEEGTK